MYQSQLCNKCIKGLDAFIDFVKKDMFDNIRGILCCRCRHCKIEKKYHMDDVLWSHLIKPGFMEDYQCWNKHVKEGLDEAEMRDSYLEWEVPTSVEEEHNDVNEAAILGLIDENKATMISTVMANMEITRRRPKTLRNHSSMVAMVKLFS
jgi:hypothetical protein